MAANWLDQYAPIAAPEAAPAKADWLTKYAPVNPVKTDAAPSDIPDANPPITQPVATAPVTTSDAHFAKNAAKEGLSSGLGTLAGLGSAVGDMFNPGQAAQAGSSLIDRGIAAYKAMKKPVDEATGHEELAPANMRQKVEGAAAEALGNPTSYLMGPIRGGVSVAGKIARPVWDMAKNALGTVGPMAEGEVFKDYAGKAADEAHLGPTGKAVAEAAGSVLGGVSGAKYQAAATALPDLEKTFLKGRAVWGDSKGFGDFITKYGEKSASQYVENVVSAAHLADPSLLPTLAESLAQGKVLGAQLPAAAAAKNNRVINNAVASIASKSPEFGAQYTAAHVKATDALKEHQALIFGNPASAERTIAEAKAPLVGELGADARTQNAPVREIDKQLQDLTAKQNDLGAKLVAAGAHPDEVAHQMQDLIAQNSEAAKAKVQPLYQVLLDAAHRNDHAPSDAAMAHVADALTDERTKHMFGEVASLMPKTNSIINRVQGAKDSAESAAKGEVSALVDADGKPMVTNAAQAAQAAPATPTFSVHDLDSLKREANNAIRVNKDPRRAPALQDLRKRVQDAIESVGPGFAEHYGNIDAQYAKHVGIPYNEAGVAALTRADYASRVLPKLMSTPEMANHFLAASGPEGERLLKAGLLDSLRSRSLGSDGAVDAAKLAKNLPAWRIQNGRVASMIPGLDSEMKNTTSAMAAMDSAKADLNFHFGQAKAKQILSDEMHKGNRPGDIAGELVNNPVSLDHFLEQHERTPDTLRAARAIVLDQKVMGAANPMEALKNMDDRGITKLFGPQYKGDVQQLADMAGKLSTNAANVPFNINKGVAKDFLDEATGTNIAQAQALFRQQVSSTTHKALNVASRFLAKGSSQKQEKEMMAVMLDPERLHALVQMAAAKEKKGLLNVSDLEDMTKGMVGRFVAPALKKFARGGLIGAMHPGIEPDAQVDAQGNQVRVAE